MGIHDMTAPKCADCGEEWVGQHTCEQSRKRLARTDWIMSQMRRSDSEETSTLICPCGESFEWSGLEDGSSAWLLKHERCVRYGANEVRMIRKYLDDGILHESEVAHRVLSELLQPHLDAVEKHGESMIASSWCGSKPPPPKRAIVELDVSYVKFTTALPLVDPTRSGT
jgi:hypothetical protein